VNGMPNWCENELQIEGEKERLNEVMEFFKNEKGEVEFDFNKLIPYPEEYQKMDDEGDGICGKGFNSGGYEWCCKNWGTKWNACEINLDDSNMEFSGYIEYSFDTAWSPPKPVILALTKKFPKLKIYHRYFECGAAYNGLAVYENGILVKEEEGAYFGNRGG
jgi:hypothetical protein